MKKLTATVATVAAVGLLTLASPLFAITTVTSIAPAPAPGVWFEFDVRPGGTAGVVDLTGSGGDLENNQPLPIGSALITTDLTNAAKAEVGVANNYGKAVDIFPTLNLSYSFHKATNPGQNASAAPSIKLTIHNPGCGTGVDCFGTLVYESYVQGAGNPSPDTWTTATITPTSGTFWWTGGFGLPSSFGGPPYDTLDTWLTNLGASPDFAGADVVVVSVGVGSFNQGQIGYFDDVRISHQFAGGFNERYNFEPPALPAPADHFQCYDIKRSTKLDPQPIVDLEDQFAIRENVKVKKKASLYCTPVDKNGEGIVNPDNHLTCYKIKKYKPNRKVTVENQFGEQSFKLEHSELLCVPSVQTDIQETKKKKKHHDEDHDDD
jgi:hypothetical protein